MKMHKLIVYKDKFNLFDGYVHLESILCKTKTPWYKATKFKKKVTCKKCQRLLK